MTKSPGAGHKSLGLGSTRPEEIAVRLNPCILEDLVEQEAGEEPPLTANAGPSTGSVPPAAQRPNVRFEDVYDDYFEFVWRSLRLLGVNRESLDDVVQDVFGTLSRQLPHFEGRSSLRTWVFGIAQYTAANHRRTERRKSAPLQPLDDDMVSAEPGPHAHAEAKHVADVIVEFCAELDEGRRTVFVLGLLEDVPAAEIAGLLGIPVNTVYSRVRALRHALRSRLEQGEAES
jgi:RNA polymerase sigma-70 factor (ECF subfamily)